MANENPGCLGFILSLLGLRPSQTAQPVRLPYRQRDDFLSAAELAFFQVLQPTVASHFYVCAKVRVSDLLYVVDRRSNMGHANRIDRKHVDFVLCDLKSMKPRLVVELDDSSHQRKDRQERDELVDAAFEAAELPVLHVPWQRTYSPDELKQQIRNKLNLETATVADAVESGLASVDFAKIEAHPALSTAERSNEAETVSPEPLCPKCKIAMVQRQASRGKHQGRRFWACRSYPECRQIIAID